MASDLIALTADSFVVNQDSDQMVLDVLSNDRFLGGYGGAKQITSVSAGSQGGELSISADGRSVIYSPPPGYISPESLTDPLGYGKEVFVYVVDGEATATATVTVRPAVSKDSYEFLANGPQVTLDVLANDVVIADRVGPGRITSVSSTTQGGEIEISPDGKKILYKSDPEFRGVETFSYVVDDTFETHVSIKLKSPVRDDGFVVGRNSGETKIDVANNDCFGDVSICTTIDFSKITNVSTPSHGQVRIADDGRSVLYRPNDDYRGPDSFTYTADNQFIARVQLDVQPQSDRIVILQNASTTNLDVLSNDLFSPSYNGARRITDVESQTPTGGTLTIADDGKSIHFTPFKDFVGWVSFDYEVDGSLVTNATIEVREFLQPDNFYNIWEGSTSARLTVLENDQFPADYQGDRKITAIEGTMRAGTIAITSDGKGLDYVPTGHGYENFTYVVDDKFRTTVYITVQALASDDYRQVGQFTSENVIDILSNDFFSQTQYQPLLIADAPNFPPVDLSKIELGTPDHGGQVSLKNGTVFYTPAPEFTGIEEFTYTVDGRFTGTAYVNVEPAARNDQFRVNENVVATSIAPLINDGIRSTNPNYVGAGRITAATSDKGGQVQISSDGATILYTPAADFYGEDVIHYTLDGVSSADVQVSVLRHLRDDDFHVETGSTNNVLKVLVNDDFDRQYRGDRKITGVSTTSNGGTVSFAADGKSIFYSPAAGYSGTDSFTYRVDGQFTANVRLAVNNSRPAIDPAFDSTAALSQYLLDEGLARWESSFGKEYYAPEVYYALSAYASDSVQLRSHSDTNVQVAGVDEADIVETDGNYIYTLTGGDLVITSAYPAAETKVVSRFQLSGTPAAQFLRGDTLTVLSHTTATDPVWSWLAYDVTSSWMPPRQYSGVTVTILNIHDRSHPMLVSETKLDGEYFDARAVNDQIFVVAHNTVTPPEPEHTCRPRTDEERQDPSGNIVVWRDRSNEICIYESRDSYIARVHNMANSVLPHYTAYDQDGNVVRSGILVDTDDIYGDPATHPSSFYSLVAFDISNADPGPVAATGVLTSGSATLFASLNDVYLLDPSYDASKPIEDRNNTSVWKVHYDADAGTIAPIARGSVPGTVLNQFSIDEYDGMLRVATTTNQGIGPANDVYILADDAGVLEVVGALQDLAPMETIYSVRFFGDRAIVVTYRTIDPLFTIDLHDPASPSVAGALKLPGFSSYIQPIDQNHVLTFGRSGPSGWDGPPQISLFDITNLNKPTLIDQTFVGGKSWSTTAWDDHHAVSYFPEYQVLAIPYNDSWWTVDGQTAKHEMFVFKIDPSYSSRNANGITTLGKVSGDSGARRNVRIDDAIYSVFDDSIQVVDISDPSHVIANISIARDPNTVGDTTGTGNDQTDLQLQLAATRAAARSSPTPFDDPELGKAIAAAQTKLAEHFNVAQGSAVLVSAEQNRSQKPDAAPNSFHIVLRDTNENQYLLEADAEGNVSDLTADFEFAAAPPVEVWHNQDLPTDTTGDQQTSPLDALTIINELNLRGARALRASNALRAVQQQPAVRFDVNGDSYVSAIDVLLVINEINLHSNLGGAHGEGESIDEAAVVTTGDGESASFASPDEVPDSVNSSVDETLTNNDVTAVTNGPNWRKRYDSAIVELFG